ncbi:NAD(P)H-dependent oxidoreductase [Halomonas sp. McH1-25]|uniref:FMN-dependent NADH-azoreductase n=1 Tax=unclassified Halomonas TaxID=2609666 RepID=UPI001EF5DE8A|nr:MULTISPECIES: NAD(P)H-dependent oxidoreductase [unclassified Halomonas]MCG7601206.1 NAD(P)H-dependent oxidoreductase [Halomonas sp. McH1-25]MCP1341896.1 NAD(P)H-dependent oxidoreductase [Halomonas sp. FL8]MCP1360161.1 NAD(P)H-dependent oxidoreductase [Halomonas sp. BBD45]
MTSKLLLINSSILGDSGQSRALAEHFKAQVATRDGLTLTERDVGAEPLPHLDGLEVGSWMVAEDERDATQRELAARSEALVDELLAHDVLVLAVPLYNLGIPSQLKSWFDRVLRAGKTFRYTENGPQGLVAGKRAIILAARGGQYAGTELDSQTPHLRHMLGLMGITEVDFVYAEGLNMGEGRRGAALREAQQAIDALVETL